MESPPGPSRPASGPLRPGSGPPRPASGPPRPGSGTPRPASGPTRPGSGAPGPSSKRRHSLPTVKMDSSRAQYILGKINATLGAIQMVRDTLGGGGSGKCHTNFFCFLNSDLKAFKSKKSSSR